MHLPHHFGYSLPAEPVRKTAVLVEAFDGLLGFSAGEGGLPSSVAVAAAMCEAEGGGKEGRAVAHRDPPPPPENDLVTLGCQETSARRL